MHTGCTAHKRPKEGVIQMSETNANQQKMKFCKHCGQQIPEAAVICTHCGCQVEEMQNNAAPQQIVINNSNQSSNTNTNTNQNVGMIPGARLRNKWVSLILCVCLGYLGAHKFYEGKTLGGLLYLCTFGFFFIGVVLDFIALLGKPNPYIVV